MRFPTPSSFFDYIDFVFRFHGKFLPALSHHAIGYFSYAIAFLYSMIGYSPLILKMAQWFSGQPSSAARIRIGKGQCLTAAP